MSTKPGQAQSEHVASDPDLTQGFEREAKTVAALSHPHICPVFDVGEQDGINFLVMEYLEGETVKGGAKLDHRGGGKLDH